MLTTNNEQSLPLLQASNPFSGRGRPQLTALVLFFLILPYCHGFGGVVVVVGLPRRSNCDYNNYNNSVLRQPPQLGQSSSAVHNRLWPLRAEPPTAVDSSDPLFHSHDHSHDHHHHHHDHHHDHHHGHCQHDTDNDNDNDDNPQLQAAYRGLLDQIVATTDTNHIPSLLTRHLDLLLDVVSKPNRLAQWHQEFLLLPPNNNNIDNNIDAMQDAVETVLRFTEDFVQQTATMERENQEFLGYILRTVSDRTQSARAKEVALDTLLSNNRDLLTPGLLRHIDSQLDRIGSAPQQTSESHQLLEFLRVIQARVVEELAPSEAALILGQLVSYESTAERLAVLEAGLRFRGPQYAQELLVLTTEALEGFRRIIGGSGSAGAGAGAVDPGLVTAVEEIHQRLQQQSQGGVHP